MPLLKFWKESAVASRNAQASLQIRLGTKKGSKIRMIMVDMAAWQAWLFKDQWDVDA